MKQMTPTNSIRVEKAFCRTGETIDGFSISFFDTAKEREKITVQLKDLLARNEHLRKKDFDRMMQSILSYQIEKEIEIGELVNNYFKEQKDVMNLLSGNLAKIKEASKEGKEEKIRKFHEEMNDVFVQQEAKKEDVSVKLKEFQTQQQKMRSRFLELLSKGRQLRIKDIKVLLEEFDVRRKERLAQHEQRKIQAMMRKKVVYNMLNGFKKERAGKDKKRQEPKQG